MSVKSYQYGMAIDLMHESNAESTPNFTYSKLNIQVKPFDEKGDKKLNNTQTIQDEMVKKLQLISIS